MANNIYDVAGNELEWTTEVSNRITSGIACPCVRRGGYFSNSGSNGSASSRGAHPGNGTYSMTFRPVLYIK